MAKVAKETKFLLSSGGSNYFYINRKNKKKNKGESKLALRKYDPILRKHVLFEEKKLSEKKKVQAKAADSGKATDAAKSVEAAA